ncbi:MAG: hypothetical protein AAGL99_13190 [Pseudomonadota bacterium]
MLIATKIAKLALRYQFLMQDQKTQRRRFHHPNRFHLSRFHL